MRKRKIVIGNWKMNPRTLEEAEKLFKALAKSLPRVKKTEIVVCPPYLYLEKLKKHSRKIILGAQDAFWEETGAFTGEISAEMLYNLGVRYVILGHSERRNPEVGIGETNAVVNRKIKGALAAGLVPVVCIGERERADSHEHFHVVKKQLEECLKGVERSSISRIIIAYEPIWAISSTPGRRDAKPTDSHEMAIFIRKIVSDLSTPEIAAETRVIYGGSADESDAKEFLESGGVDGLLPGRASLDPEQFAAILKICEALKN